MFQPNIQSHKCHISNTYTRWQYNMHYLRRHNLNCSEEIWPQYTEVKLFLFSCVVFFLPTIDKLLFMLFALHKTCTCICKYHFSVFILVFSCLVFLCPITIQCQDVDFLRHMSWSIGRGFPTSHVMVYRTWISYITCHGL